MATFGRSPWGGPRLAGWAAVPAVLLVWQAAVTAFAVPEYLLPAPAAVAAELAARRSLVWSHTVATAVEALAGFALAAAAGCLTGAFVAAAPWVQRGLYPVLVSVQTLPKVAVAPLLILWLGLGLWPKVVLAGLMAYFPVVAAAAAGLTATDPRLLAMARTMGAGRAALLLKVQIPGALPFVFSGLKVAASLAVVGAVVGEFVGADRGLGYLLLVANGLMNTRLLFAALAALMMLGLGMYYSVAALEGWLVPWRPAGDTGRAPGL